MSDGNSITNSFSNINNTTTSTTVINKQNENVTRTIQNIKVKHTYCRKIIRKTDENGVVSEQIIEEGQPIDNQQLLLPLNTLQLEDSSLSDKSLSCENINKKTFSGDSHFRAFASFNSISDTGERRSACFSTNPNQAQFLNADKKMITDSADDELNLKSMQMLSGSSGEKIDNGINTFSPTITTRFTTTKKATVTKTLTINGETKTMSKSAFMSFTGESMVQAKSTMDDMESLLQTMKAQMKIEGFNILNQFMLSSNTSLTDHLTLAGGNTESSLLAIEAPPITDFSNKSNKSNEYIIPDVKVPENDTKIEEKQKEEVRQIIIRIKDQKSSTGLFWSNMDDVRNSGVLDKMRKEEIHLQESIFEILTSEASYNISLDILIDLFYKSDLLNPNKEDAIINAIQKHQLFSNILLIKGVSLQLLKDLEARWSQYKPKIFDLADIILKHAENAEFEEQYVNYLAHQSYQIESLRSLLQNEAFKSAMRNIQNDPKCCKLSLDSFLALPMQRLTRLKLLLDVVLKLMNESKELLNSIPVTVVKNHENALGKLKELLRKSETKKFEVDQKAKLTKIWKMVEFRSGCKNIDIGLNSLIKDGELKAHTPQKCSNVLKKLSKKRQPSFYIIVITNYVLITKKKDHKIVVLDYCDRQLVEATEKKTGSELTLQIKFGRSESESMTDEVQFDIISKNERDQWIKAITAQVDSEEKRN